MNARWVQLNTNQRPSVYSPPPTWVAVDEDDEILATVAEGNSMWHAQTGSGLSASSQCGAFLTEEAAKRRVEKWLHPIVFPDPNVTAWVYKVTP